MEGREKIRPLPGFGGDTEEEQLGEQGGARADRLRLLDQVARDGLRVLRQHEARYLPESVDKLSATTRRHLDELTQRVLAEWRNIQEVQ